MDVYDIARVTPNSEVRWSEESIIAAEPWKADALCATIGGDLWFPDTKRDTDQSRKAKAICAECPVIAECLAYALRNREEEGIWGGRTAAERAPLMGKRPATPQLRRECARGHEFSEANTRHRTFTAPDGSVKRRRDCLTCERDANERKKARGVR